MDEVRILIADESSVYKKMFIKVAEEMSEHNRVTHVACGNEALDKIRRQDYDIIVIDAEIPGLNVMSLLGEIAREIPKALILVTARPSRADESLSVEVLARGANICMTKPIYSSYNENVDALKREIGGLAKILHKRRSEENKKQRTEPSATKKRIKRK